ncbi:Similar to Sugar transporter STL1; acc. no. P39932 [Pyronema omphalodes CBS 100304]|uniref:Similar to Sugar transporter STL1 acc. no. P39932 n=1 Tax=Pyronema omphalodes (strain CBS 100304) TaxID=1076935 RepID=U4LAJ6_PYROM|nr:Similar to Sugar transporter STL1; acc. no. P39932 [Pyronema omphalodes CBS 100304]
MAPHLGLRGKKLSFFLSAICTTGFLLFGYDQGVMSGLITAPEFNHTIPETKGNPTMQGLVTAIYEIGCLAGAMLVLFVGEKFGRRKSIMAGAFVMILGVLLQIFTFLGHQPLAQFIIGRVVMGVGNGMNTSSIPAYQAETAASKHRGMLICIQGGSIAFGTLISYWLNYGVSFTGTDVVWRFPIAFQLIFAIIIIAGMLVLPESPRWLLARDMHEEGTRVISALYDQPEDSEVVQREKRIIMDAMMASGQVGNKARFSDLLTRGKTQHLRRCILGASSQIMQQIGGCNAVIYYFPILMQESLNQPRHMALILGGINMAVYSVFATSSWFTVERAGRRKLFLLGSIGQMLSMTITFACLIPKTESAAKGAAAGLFLYIATFGATWLPLPWLYPAEINPLRTRGKANAVSTINNWLFNFAVVMVTPIMVDKIKWATYLVFALFNASFIPFIYFFFPETKGRTLEELDIVFAKGQTEGISYVKAAKELPMLNHAEIEEYSIRYGLFDNSGEKGHAEMVSSVEDVASKETS